MNTELAVNNTALAAQQTGKLMEQVLIGGDLSKLSPPDRVMYYQSVCASVGLNPLTKPFEYITLNGKLTLYAKRDCTDQLRQIHGVSILIVSREVVEDCYVVTARATDKNGRNDESIGAVPIQGLKGEARSNALMKAETKAKRRVTLSVCGLGLLDETEVGSIPGAYPMPSNVTPNAGAGESLMPEEVDKVKALSEKVIEWIASGSIGDAFAELDNAGLDNDQKLYIWTLLDSKQRSALKKEQKRVQEEHAAKPQNTPVSKLISDAQRKRLEARIGELKLDRDDVKAQMRELNGKEHFADMSQDEYTELDESLDNMTPKSEGL